MYQSHRNPTGRSRHDRRVAIEARSYEARKYLVQADISGYPQPETINGYIPDVFAEKSGYVSIVEVETPDTLNTRHALAQARAFRRACRYNYNWHFRKVVAR